MNRPEQYLKIFDDDRPLLVPINNILMVFFDVGGLQVQIFYKNTNIGSLKSQLLVFIPLPGGFTTFESAKILIPFYITQALSTGVPVLETDLKAALTNQAFNL